MYLGDGCITELRRTQWLRITLDAAYPGIIRECREAVSALVPGHKVSIIQRPSRAVDVASWSQLWPELIPQHGRGPKHLRPIHLEPWQTRVVEMEPRAFIRGLFHSDGCYFTNPIWSKAGKLYLYDRYVFYNKSADIKGLFRWACTLLGVDTRVVGSRAVSVAKRESVARLNEFLGAKD
jgi:hypothetical protein